MWLIRGGSDPVFKFKLHFECDRQTAFPALRKRDRTMLTKGSFLGTMTESYINEKERRKAHSDDMDWHGMHAHSR